ncbi:MAG: beta-lactamase family protein [Verrucomicrobia bacterium]|nr:beta-lactamase family protein [Verrucomicrobiota bacterium]
MRLSFLLLLLLIAPLRAADDARITRVENGLLPGARIAGAPVETWNLADRMAHYHVPGVSIAVIDHDAIAWARGYGLTRAGGTVAVTPDTLFQAASISKPVTAAAALSLVEAGRLTLDTDVNRLLKSWQLPASDTAEGEPVTLRELLSHTAGLGVHGFDGYAAGAPRPALLQILNGTPPANSPPIRIDLKPGTLWRYSGGGYCIVQQLLIDTAGQDFPTLLHDRVLTPAGMTASTFAQPLPAPLAAKAAAGHDDTGQPIPGEAHIYPELAAAGLWTTPTDLARFALAFQHSLAGQPGLFSRSTAEKMLTVPLPGSDYGLGLGVKDTGGDLQISHSGANEGFRALLIAYPRSGRGAIVMTNGDNGGLLAIELMRAIAKEYGWPDFKPVEKIAAPLAPAAFGNLAGRYERDDHVLVFYRKENHFYLRETGRPRVELFPKSDTEFFLLDDPTLFIFKRGANGLVSHVIRRGSGAPQVYPRVYEEAPQPEPEPRLPKGLKNL